MSIKDAERVTMQATPLNNPAGIPNDRDTADPRVIPGPDHDSAPATVLPTRAVRVSLLLRSEAVR